MKRILFYFLSFTWGILLSLPGLIIIAVLALFKRVHCFHGRLYGVIGQYWGGFNLGCFFLTCSASKTDEGLRAHECGHGLQNIIWGPLTLFVITIPSGIRYWYRELKYNRKGLVPSTEYDAIWFEKQATNWGYKYIITDQW